MIVYEADYALNPGVHEPAPQSRPAPRDMSLTQIDSRIADQKQRDEDTLDDLDTAYLGLLRIERDRRRNRVPRGRLLPPKPAASGGVLNVLDEVSGRLERQSDPVELGASQAGLHTKALELAIKGGYLRRTDTRDPDTDGGRYRLHLTDAEREQIRMDEAYRAGIVPPREHAQLTLWGDLA